MLNGIVVSTVAFTFIFNADYTQITQIVNYLTDSQSISVEVKILK